MARAFQHPEAESFSLDAVLHALSDPVRRGIVKKLGGRALNCGAACGELPPSTISFHCRVLREAGLIRSEKKGVEVINTLREAEIEDRFPGLLRAILDND
jgi:DNA-binding transcriptional ArsR family regulator